MGDFTVILREEARVDLAGIKDQRTKKAVVTKLRELQTEPEKRGKPLRDELKNHYSVRAAGQRYRIIYEVEEEEGVVTVVVIGIRREGDKQDVYQIARRRLGKR